MASPLSVVSPELHSCLSQVVPGQVLAELGECPAMLRDTVKNLYLEPVPKTLIPQPESPAWLFF